MSDTLNTLNDALAGFGISLSEKTRLTFGAPVLKALADIPQGGKVFVACKGGDSLLALPGKLNDEARKVVRVIDATETDYAKVRPHVANFAKSRKVRVTIATMKNADSEAVGFTVTKSK
jgi:hypothetical protein